jgi:type VI secretion system secreted protein Hcp
MAFDAFMKLDGIPGESTDDKHKDWIEIASFGHEMKQPASATASNAGGATAQRVNHADFRVTKLLDRASPKLYEACCTGKHLKDVTIEVCRAGGDKVKYMEIKLEQVIVSGVRTASHTAGTSADEDFPTEEIAFNYGKIKWTYTQQKRSDGSGGGNVSAGWDLTANRTAA